MFYLQKLPAGVCCFGTVRLVRGSVHPPPFDSQRHRFEPTGHTEFGEEIAGVCLDGGNAHHQGVGNLGVMVALDHELQDPMFAFGQSGLVFLGNRHGVHQNLGCFFGERWLLVHGGMNRSSKFIGGDILQEIADSPCFDRCFDQVFLAKAS